MAKKRNFMLLGVGGLTLFAIFATAISTFAWFTASHNPSQAADIVSGSSGVNIGTTTGFKKVGSEIRTHVVGESEEQEDNDGSTQQDLTFDVPTQGSGYYLLKQHHNLEDDSYTFLYANAGTVKLDEYEGTHRATKSITLEANAVYRFMKYVTENHETVNKKVAITTTDEATDAICTHADGDVHIKAGKGGTYTVWLDHRNGTLGLEKSVDLSQLHKKSAKLHNPKRAISQSIPAPSASEKTIYLTLPGTDGWDGGYLFCHYWGGSSSTSWPSPMSTNMHFLYKDSDNKDVWYINVPSNTTYVIFLKWNSGNDNKTGDTAVSGTASKGFYLNGKNGDGTWKAAQWNPQVGTKTFYFYNYLGKNQVYSTPHAYVYYKNESSDDVVYNAAYPGAAMSAVGGQAGIYSITVPSYLANVVFSNGGTSSQADATKTSDVTLGSNGQYFKINSGSPGSYSGAWYTSISPSATTSTIYLYDPNQVFGSSVSGHYCYPFSSTNAAVAPAWPGSAMTAVGGTANLYSFAVSESYDKIIFTNSSGSSQTADLDKNTSEPYYVMHALNNIVNYKSGIKSPSATTRDFYIYDLDSIMGDSAPKAYAYLDNSPSATDYYFTSYQNSAWPGVSTSAVSTYEGNSISRFYKVSVSVDFTHVIFNNGKTQSESGAIQISDALAASWTEDNNIFILKNETSVGEQGQTLYGGEWVDSLSIVTLYKDYYFYDGSTYTLLDGGSFSEVELTKEVTSKYKSYTPAYSSFPDEYIQDGANGIYYRFVAEDGWKKSDGTAYSPTTGLVGVDTKLYKRMICTASNLTTFYVDVSDTYLSTGGNDDMSYRWTGVHLHAWNEDTDESFGLSSLVAPYLYRVTLPNSIDGFQFNNGYPEGDANWTNDASLSDATRFLHVGPSYDYGKHAVSWCHLKDTNIGTASILYKRGSADWAVAATMSLGDIDESNLFVYELAGFELNVGDLARIKIDTVTAKGTALGLTAGTYYGFSDLDPSASKVGFNPSSAGTGNSLQITEKARYTFYLTTDKKLAVAQVPSYGNGFYIMSAAGGVKGYGGGIKCAWANDEHTAGVYRGFNVKTVGETYYIKSYLDAIDHLYTSFDTSRLTGDEVSVNTTTGVITFNKATRYNITITSGEGEAAKVTISLYQIEEFFVMNPPSTSGTIVSQALAIVIEVQFTTTNSESVRIGLDINNPISGFVGVGFYASATKLNDPWNDMHSGGRYSLSSAATLDSNLVVTSAQSGTTMYAYILVDYTSTSVPSTPAGTLSFTLRSTQI